MRRPVMSGSVRRRSLPAGAVLLLPALIIPLFILAGCASTAPPASAPPPEPAPSPAPAAPAPATTLRVAGLDVSGFRGRIETKHVEELAALIAGRRIEVLALQGITRYPTVATRVDLVEALAKAAGMRPAFGETINLSGRQSGNAVLSAYPIASSDAQSYDGISGSGFEGALRAIVDAGTRPLVVISTLLPRPLTPADARVVSARISRLAAEAANDPVLVLGNLPAPPDGGGWESAGPSDDGGRCWFLPRGIVVTPAGGAACSLGRLLIADVGVLPQEGRR